MKIQDNYLPEEVFKKLQYHCYKTDSNIISIGKKLLSVINTPDFVYPFLQKQNEKLFLSFVRKSYDQFDNELNIHADNRIAGTKVTSASVLYINYPDGITENGTAFYFHEKYGSNLPQGVSNEEHDRLLLEDANDLSKWQEINKVQSVPNRLVEYNGNLFHAKYPANIDLGLRIVMVNFYTAE